MKIDIQRKVYPFFVVLIEVVVIYFKVLNVGRCVQLFAPF